MEKTANSNYHYKIDFEDITRLESSFGRKKLDTLAQTGTDTNNKKPIEIPGLGSDIKEQSTLFAKAKKKLVTQEIAKELIAIAKKKGDRELEKSFRNSYYCLSNIIVSNDKLYGNYCKNRICTNCNSIRKAKIINKYLPTIQSWEGAYLVTLTAKSCYANHLKSRMRAMKRAFRKIYSKCKKQHQRGHGPRLIGIKSLECNFNPTTRTYNPHYHFIVPSWEIAILLKREWMKLWTKKYTNGWGQDIRKIENNLEGIIEAVKYSSKIFTEPDPNKKREKASRYVYISALYNIHSSMRGIRLFDRFGFNLPKNNEKYVVQINSLIEYEELSYSSEIHDWVNSDTGETLSGYIPTPELSNLLNHRINRTLE